METAFAPRKDEKEKVTAPAGRAPESQGPTPDERGASEGMPLFLQRASASGVPPTVPGGSLIFQTKLIVGRPDDVYEREADRVAEAVTSATSRHGGIASLGSGPLGDDRIQRSCAGCDQGHPCAECADEEEEGPAMTGERHVQRKELPPSSSRPHLPVSGITPAGDSGTPLSTSVRDKVEPVLGVNLERVRVHATPTSRAAAQTLHARAFTNKEHIWLGANQDPEDTALLAHEATHVVQQTAGSAPVETIQRQVLDNPRTDDGEEVRRRMQRHIDEAVGEPENRTESPQQSGDTPATADPTSGRPTPAQGATAAPRARQATREIDRAELEEQKGELQPESHPVVDRPAEERPRVDRAAGAAKEEVDKPPDLDAQLGGPGAQAAGAGAQGPDGSATPASGAEGAGPAAATAPGAEGTGPTATPGAKAGGDKAGGKKAAAGDDAAAAAAQAASMADQAFSLADSQPVPDSPPLLVPPAPVEPIDAKGIPLPGNPQADLQILDLADRAQALREGGHQLQAQATEGRTNAQIIQGNIGLVKQGVAQAEGGVHTSQDHLAYRRTVVTQAQQALTVSEQKAANVAEQAPNYVEKSAEGKAKSGPLASESGQMSAENKANTPDDDGAAEAQEQGGKLDQVSSDAATTDDAISQAQTASGTLVQDAAQAKQVNTDTRGKVDTIQQTLSQTDQRLGEMQAHNTMARSQLDDLSDQPAVMTAQADELDSEGQALVQASVDLESQLHQTQKNYTAGMQTVPGVEMSAEAGSASGSEPIIQRQPTDAAQIAAPPDTAAPNSASDIVPVDAGPVDDMTPGPAPAAAPPQPSSVNVAAGLPSWLTGEPEANAEERQRAQQREEHRRADEIAEITNRADGHFERLSAGDKMGIAVQLMGRNLFGSVHNISWPGWGGIAKGAGHLAAGLIDPRAPLMGVVGGLNMIINGVANFARRPSWGGALKMAADIATGLTIILGSITALAGVIIAIMTAITILSFGTAAPITGPVIAFCATVMSTVGGWTLWVGAIALLLQELVFLKNLYEAATAQTAEQLQQQSDNMTEDARNAGNVVMQMGMAKLAQVGGRNMQSAIQEAGGGVRFAARMGAEGLPNRVATGVRQAGGIRAYASEAVSSARGGVSAAGGLGRFAVQSTVRGARGVGGFVRRTARELMEEAPAGLSPGQGLSRDFLVGKEVPRGSYFAGSRSVLRDELAIAETRLAPRPGPAAVGETPPAVRPAEMTASASPSEAEMLQNTSTKAGSQLSRQELNGELEMVHRVEPTPIHEGPYVEKVELQNGHEWRQTEEGTWCRFSPGPPDCFGIGPTGPRPVEAPTVEAAPTNVPEEAPRVAGEPTKPPTAGAEQPPQPKTDREWRQLIDNPPPGKTPNDMRYERYRQQALAEGRESPLPREKWERANQILRENQARGRVNEDKALSAAGVENNNYAEAAGKPRRVVEYPNGDEVVRPDGITDTKVIDVKSINEGTVYYTDQLAAEKLGARSGVPGGKPRDLAVVIANDNPAVVRPSSPLANNATVLHHHSQTGTWSAWDRTANNGLGGWLPISAGDAVTTLGGAVVK